MNVVIYEPDLNPLTIVELPMGALEVGARMGSVYLQAMPLTSYSPSDDEDGGIGYQSHQFTVEFRKLQIDDARGYCIIARDKALKAWLMPPYGKARTPSEFLRNRDVLARQLRQVLARGVGGD